MIAVIGSSGVASIVVDILQHHWQKTNKTNTQIAALVAAQKVIMVDRVRYIGKQYIQQGFIFLADKETLNSMYAAYKALGGNGDLETVMSEVNRLEVRG